MIPKHSQVNETYEIIEDIQIPLGLGTVSIPVPRGLDLPGLKEFITSIPAIIGAAGSAVVVGIFSGIAVIILRTDVTMTAEEEEAWLREAEAERQKNSDRTEGESKTSLPNQGTVKGNVEGDPPVDAGKQGKYVQGHNNSDSSKSQWSEGEDGVDLTQEAWQKGKTLSDGTKVWDTGQTTGSNGETGV